MSIDYKTSLIKYKTLWTCGLYVIVGLPRLSSIIIIWKRKWQIEDKFCKRRTWFILSWAFYDFIWN